MARKDSFNLDNINFFDSKEVIFALKDLINQSNDSIKNQANIYTAAIKKWINDYDKTVAAYELVRARNYESARLEGLLNISKKTGKITSINAIWGQQHKVMQDEYNILKNQMVEVISSGYYLWESVRELFTGSTIYYNILYSSSEKGQKVLHEAYINVEELLQRANFNLTRNGKSFGLSLERLRQNEKTNTLERLDIAHTTFYNQLVNRYLDMSRNINRGTLYEVYKQISNFKSFPTKRGVTDKWFSSGNDEMVKRKISQSIADNSSGRKIGDYGNIQLKNIENAAAQLSAIGSLRDDFENFLLFFTTQNSKELLNLFTIEKFQKDGHVDQITRKANKEAQEELSKRLNEIFSLEQ